MSLIHCVGGRIPRVFISEELFTIKSHSPFGLSSMKQLINDRNNRCDRGTMVDSWQSSTSFRGYAKGKASAGAQASVPNRPFSLVPFNHPQLVPVTS